MNWQEMTDKIKILLDAKTNGATAYDYWRALSQFDFKDKPDLQHIVECTLAWRQLGISNSTILHRYAAVKWIFKHFPREFDPIDVQEMVLFMSGVKKDEREMVFATREEAEFIISRADARVALIIGMAYYAGLRLGEIAQSKVSHWQKDSTTGSLSLLVPSGDGERTKNGKTRRIPVLPQLAALFHTYIKTVRRKQLKAFPDTRIDALFLNNRKQIGAITKRRLGMLIENACVECGLPHLHPHSFRHGLATKLARETGDIKLVKEVLGHRSIQSTLRYIHLSQKEIADNMQAAFD